ncbi:ankyrin repeat domain-containing protein [Methylobacillus sp. Pita2]|uniref:ankyrin repeat domain-containing protein n=1 Tax=Methylobacillus sp. Pita2 TaxID=3383245 RepID=UPI0038B69F25
MSGHNARQLLENFYKPGDERKDILSLISRCPDHLFEQEFDSFVESYALSHLQHDRKMAGYQLANQWSGGKASPLVAAIQAGKENAARKLVEAGARVNESTGPYDSKLFALGAAVNLGQHETVKMLLDAGADPNASNINMPHSFITAYDDQQMLHLLAKYGATIDDLKARHPMASTVTIRCIQESLHNPAGHGIDEQKPRSRMHP